MIKLLSSINFTKLCNVPIYVIKGIITIFIISINLNLYSQSYPFRHYTVEDGLPSSETYHVFQDSKGYIWIATDNGVSRYNSYNFRNFTKQDGLPDNTVFEIFEDYKNRIWFVPHSAKLSYFQNDSIYEYKYNDSLQSRMRNSTSPSKLSFMVDSASNIFYGDKRNGAFKIDSLGNIKEFKNKAREQNLIVKGNKVIFDKFSVLHSIKESKFNLIENGNNIYKSHSSSIFYTDMYMATSIDKNIFIAIEENLFQLKTFSVLSSIKLNQGIIWISQDNDKNLWLGTRNGAYCYKNADISIKAYHLLINKNISSVMQDKEGGYWFSTLNNGIYYLPNLHVNTLTKKEGLPYDEVNKVISDSLLLWLGLYNKVVGIKSNFIKNEINLNNQMFTRKLFFDYQNNSLWIASNFLYRYKNKNLTEINLFRKGYKSLGTQTKDIFKDNKGIIWIATSRGLFFYENNCFNPKYNTSTKKINSLCQNPINDNIFCGCNDGLWEYSLQNDSFVYLGIQNNLLKDPIECIVYNTYHNNIWLGTKTNGIVVYDQDEIYNISTRDGLSNNSITSLFLKDSVMWVTTLNGLNKITFHNKKLKHNFKIETYNKIHGLLSRELNDIYVDDSLAYVATKKGLNIINYNKIKKNSLPPPVYITNISIQNKDTIIQNHYNLPYDKNSINIEFVGLMYRNNENKEYKYQLNQNDKIAHWVETNEPYVNLSFLPPGKYNFNVIAINENNIESIQPATVCFTINPPYWKTWWFITIITLITSLILYFLYKKRVDEINKRNNLEKKLLKEVNKFRQKALSQQMNPHFIFNTLNSIQYYIYNNDAESSTNYLTKFSKLMRLILDNSQYETVSIQKELDTIKLYLELESLRIDGKFSFKILVNEEVNTEYYKIYPLLIQPYVENSIWHGLVQKGEKTLKIEIIPNEESILCIIEDNGIGRENAMKRKKQQGKHKSHGTNITNKRIETINKLYNRTYNVEFIDLKDNLGNSKGTKVLLQIPKITN